MEDKIYYLMALFDEETNHRIEEIHQELLVNEIPSTSLLPHLTLGSWTNIDENELCNWLELVCSNQLQLEVNFNHLGLFSLKVAFLAPHVSEDLIKFHARIHEKFEEYCGQMGYNYTAKSQNWVPHATLVFQDESETVLKSLPVITKNFNPFKGKLISLLLCEYNTMTEIKRYTLKSEG